MSERGAPAGTSLRLWRLPPDSISFFSFSTPVPLPRRAEPGPELVRAGEKASTFSRALGETGSSPSVCRRARSGGGPSPFDLPPRNLLL